MYKKLFLKSDRVKNVVKGHPWIFSNAIEKMEDIETGGLCGVYVKNEFIGIGYYNANTDIAVRIISRKEEVIDKNFFIKRIGLLKKKKERFIHDTDSYRIVFAESDNIPGLIVDKYNDVIVMQCHTAGIDRLRNCIAEALVDLYNPVCIYAKTAQYSRKIEGADIRESEVLYGKLKEENIISENGFSFFVDAVKGQKTGFFLDQRENRKSILGYVKGKRVLDCFCYTGAFSVYAAKTAEHVTGIDISENAVCYAEKNAKLNKYSSDKYSFITADVFDYLNNIKEGQYDVIILDPPSLAHKRTQVKQAVKAYTRLNSEALKKIGQGGILITSSCTTHIDELTFIKILYQSAVNAGCQVKVLHSAIQPYDHAYNLHFPEGRYLKFFILSVE